MIILNGGGADWGLPDISPFVMKTETHLRLAGIAYEKRRASPDASPKGQIPFIDDGGRLIGDSTFIRFHIEQEHGVDLDEGLSPLERAQSLAVEMMCEHELAPAVGYFRWLTPENFEKGPARWFDDAPEEMRADLRRGLQDEVRKVMMARGVARHTQAEITGLGLRTLRALDLFIGDKPFLTGDVPRGADAFVFAVLAATMTPWFSSPLRDHAIAMPRLVAYVVRMMDHVFPEFEWDAGLPANLKHAA